MIKAILTDIEGTTSSIDLVHQALFPYAKARLRTFLRMYGTTPDIAAQLHEVARIEGRQLTLEDAADVMRQAVEDALNDKGKA